MWLLPYLFGIGAFFGWIAFESHRLRKQRKAAQRKVWLRNLRCVNCGYDMRANPRRCPECGCEADPTLRQYDAKLAHACGLAHNAAARAGEFAVLPKHLLAAIAIQSGTGSFPLGEMGIDCAALAHRLAPGLTAGEVVRTNRVILPELRQLIEAAWDEAVAIGDGCLCTQHIILALLAARNRSSVPDAAGREADLFADTPASYESARTMVLELRANMKADCGRFETALMSCDQLLAEPNSSAMNTKAWILATCPDEKYFRPAEGLVLAKRACDLTEHKDAGCLDTLAVCEAAVGNFTEAIRLEELAIPLCTAKRREECNARLQLFLAGKPFREPPLPESNTRAISPDVL